MQIRSRLTLQFMVIVAIIMLCALFFIHIEFSEQVRDDFYSSLKSKAIMTADMIVGQEIKHPIKQKDFSPMKDLPVYTENITIYDNTDQRIYSFNPLPDNIHTSILDKIKLTGETRFTHDGYSALGMVYQDKTQRTFIIIAEAIFKSEHLKDLNNILLLVFFIFIALVAIGGWIFAGQALAPVNHIMNQVDALLPSDMSHRLKIKSQNDELARLVFTFNKLLDRIQKAFVTQKLFLSNISHELKNPLSVIISQIEVTLQNERKNADYKDTLQSVLEDVQNLNDVSNKLMQLARINSDNAEIVFQSIRIDELLWQVKSNLIKSRPEYKIGFEILNLPDDESNLLVKANEPLLKTAILNLLDNGCKFSPDLRVQLRLSYLVHSGVMLEIEDGGPGIREEDIPFIFEPFYRSQNTSSIRGSGIGLSLVTSILKLHNIKLEVLNTLPHGTIFRLFFDKIEQLNNESTQVIKSGQTIEEILASN
ncbi:MAG: HAMP domain-containing histidine kinase [Bacteroidota bacterium]|nr:HAMP domain-containing histidine kinase [Bacteroidota bacterium]